MEKIIRNSEKYCGKLLIFKKGKRASWHRHEKKTETFYIISGKCLLKYGYDEELSTAQSVLLCEDECFHIPTGLHHQVIALEDTIIMESSTEDFPDDSIRIVRGD